MRRDTRNRSHALASLIARSAFSRGSQPTTVGSTGSPVAVTNSQGGGSVDPCLSLSRVPLIPCTADDCDISNVRP